MLDFCPFDFERINLRNLAYELVFPRNWSWDRVKRETVIGEESRRYINENDKRRDRRFAPDVTVQHVILLENRKGGKNGLQLLTELIATNNKAAAVTTTIKKDIVEEEEELDDYGLDDDGFGSDDEFASDEFGDDFAQDGPIQLEIIRKNGIITFVDAASREEIMYAMPCCPYCHNRLPLGWETADDFGAVSLMAPTGGGKTTLLYSMMTKQWEAFKNLGMLNGVRLDIASAHREFDRTDTTYYQMAETSRMMCRDYGKCPDPTDRDHWIPPIFLNVKYGAHTLILGIYDNAGENLMNPDPMNNPAIYMLLDKIFAEVYLFDPTDMNISLPMKDSVDKTEVAVSDNEILSVEAQGRLQRENVGRSINAQQLLKRRREKKSLFEVYNNNLSMRHKYGFLDEMQKMYFLGVIIKCDLLENSDELTDNDDYAFLFDRSTPTDYLNIDVMTSRSNLNEQMIEELNLFEDKNIKDFYDDYGKGVSWHCISALGCDAELHGDLLGEYKPIRVAEPIISCILKRIADNGWIN